MTIGITMPNLNGHPPLSELEGRIHRLQAQMCQQGIDGTLIVQNADLFYFTGTVQRSHLYVPAEGTPLLMVRKSLARAEAESPIRPLIPAPPFRRIPEMLEEHGYPKPSRLGMELDVLPAGLYFSYNDIFDRSQIMDISGAIRQQRAVKSDYEITLIREACRWADRLAKFVPSVLTPGMREVKLAGLVEAEARRLGHQGLVRMRGFNAEIFYGHLMSGPAGAVPSFLASPTGGAGMGPALAQSAGPRKIRRNEPVVVDYVFGWQGYLADHARIFSVGRVDPELESAHAAMLEVQALLVETASAGTECGYLYEKARAAVKQRGLLKHFMGPGADAAGFVGHGIGLEVDELPVLGNRQQTILRENMIVAVEPKAVFPGKGTVGIENMFRVTADGLERLTMADDGICAL